LSERRGKGGSVEKGLSYRVGFSVCPNLEELFIAEEAGGQYFNCVAKEGRILINNVA